MFVFKAAVVGGGAVGEALAAAIAAAGVDVVTDAGEATGYAGLGDVDLVVEAVPDRLEDKRAALAALDAATPGHAILATTTSTLSVTELGDGTLRPDKVVGLHAPDPGRPLLEVVRGDGTAPETVAAVLALAQAIRRQAVVCEDAPGFVVDRVLAARAALADGPDGEERAELGALVEACLIVEDGVSTTREVDLALAAGAGLEPPFARADAAGLDAVLARLEELAEADGERFAPPTTLRRLVAQGRLGPASGQGFHAYPRPDDGEQAETVKLETRGDVAVAWLANRPVNSLSPAVVADLEAVWRRVGEAGSRALVIASSSPQVFCAGADIKAFTALDEAGGRAFVARAHALFLELGKGAIPTIAAVNGLALGGGCELALACDVRLAAQSATFGQPEIRLGIMPGFGGTQRLARLVGEGRALEMNLLGDAITAEEAYELGLVNRLVPDHELLDAALAWARKLAGQAPLSVAQVKRVSARGELERGIADEQDAFAAVFASADAREGIDAFLGKRAPRWTGA